MSALALQSGAAPVSRGRAAPPVANLGGALVRRSSPMAVASCSDATAADHLAQRTQDAQGGTESALRKSISLGLAVGIPCSAFGRFSFLQVDSRANIFTFRGSERHLGGFRCLPCGRLRSLGL